MEVWNNRERIGSRERKSNSMGVLRLQIYREMRSEARVRRGAGTS